MASIINYEDQFEGGVAFLRNIEREVRENPKRIPILKVIYITLLHNVLQPDSQPKPRRLVFQFPVLSSCSSYHRPRVPLSVCCLLQGKESGCAHLLLERAPSPTDLLRLRTPLILFASFRCQDQALAPRAASKPVLVACTGTDAWKLPSGLEAYLPLKELRIVGNHLLRVLWEDKLALQIYSALDSVGVKWTSMDLVRIGVVRESVAPVVVWIGVKPNTLFGKDGLAAGEEFEKLLVANDIYDVEVRTRESVVWSSRAE